MYIHGKKHEGTYKEKYIRKDIYRRMYTKDNMK